MPNKNPVRRTVPTLFFGGLLGLLLTVLPTARAQTGSGFRPVIANMPVQTGINAQTGEEITFPLRPDTSAAAGTDTAAAVKLSGWQHWQQHTDKITSSQLYRMTYIAVPLVVAGVLVRNESDHFRDLRNAYIPKFRHHYDDYLQYLPAATMLGLKIGGVESRSSWGRMLVSDAFSGAIMAGLVNGLKYSVKTKRPDASERNSFPSGHTATAFMTATMLHKEYGGRSPWYSIGAYSVATATAVSRQMNNRHWLSDVLVGAGIGIFSTELGYYLTDLIYKKRGIRHFDLNPADYDRKFSFFGLYMSYSTIPGGAKHPFTDIRLTTSVGSNVGLEGAWFFNRYLGIGGQLAVASIPVALDNDLYLSYHPGLSEKLTTIETGPTDMIAASAGLYASYPLTKRWLVGSKFLVGYLHASQGTISALYKTQDDMPEQRRDILKFGKGEGFNMGTGISLTFLVEQYLGVRFFCDYNIAPSRQTLTKYTDNGTPISNQVKSNLQAISLGASVSVLFW